MALDFVVRPHPNAEYFPIATMKILRTASRCRDVGTPARVRQSLILGHGFGGAAFGAGKPLLPRDPCRAAFLMV